MTISNSHSTAPARLLPWRCAFLAAAALAATAPSQAQGECPPPLIVEAWVDPYYGSDNVALVGDPAFIFGTIQAGIDALAMVPAISAGDAQGLLHLMPGIYNSDASQSPNALGPLFPNNTTNIETFPIRMEPGVSVQGTGAKECVVQVRGAEGANQHPMPFSSMGCSGNLPDTMGTVAFDFSFLFDDTEELLDGVTIQGGHVQALFEAEVSIRARISNCVFDMRTQPDQNILGSVIGVLTSPIWDASITDYPQISAHLFNNTFLQATKYGDGLDDVLLAPADSVAICDVNDPDPTGSGQFPDADMDLTWRGVSDLHIQNNLIRSLGLSAGPAPAQTAFLGVADSDTSVVLMSMAVSNTNAFGAGLVGGTNATGSLCSAIVGGPAAMPIPAVDTTIMDPAFFGEMHSSRQGVSLFDVRIMPTSPMVDAGQAPEGADPCLRTLEAVNGQVHTQMVNPGLGIRMPLSSFDLDGEGHGNSRVVGANVDIGFDEWELLLCGGSYGENTRSHNAVWDPALPFPPPTGSPVRYMIMATTGPFAYAITVPQMYVGPVNNDIVLLPAWNNQQGTLAIPAVVAGLTLWIDIAHPAYINIGTLVPTAQAWTNWIDGSTHNFGEFVWTADETIPGFLPPSYWNNQIVQFVSGGVQASNLQSEYL